MSIDKITPDDALSQSKDLIHDNIDKLKALFPEIVTEGKIDFKVLQQVLGEELEEEEEYYRFTWAGKSQARREAHKPSTGTLRPAKEESLDWDTTQNMYVEGDNLEVLKLMQKSYAGKIKMIYIDPPYNKGKDFVYKDNYKDNLKNYQEVTGQIDSEGNKTSTNSDSDGRYHSNWLNMMYPRLRLARNLLKEDGVIFMSIDDNEVNNLQKISKEIFGDINVETYIWYLNDKTEGSFVKTPSNTVRNEHEYIVTCYKSKIELGKYLDYRFKDRSDFTNTDNDPRGEWMSGNISRNGIKTTTGSKYFTITTPTGKSYSRNWTISKEEFKLLNSENRIYFSNNGDGVPRLKIFKNEPSSNVQSSLFQNLRSSSTGKKEVSSLFNGIEVFDFPKPTKILKRLIEISKIKKDDIILDFFSGSSTSAHAVLESDLSQKNKVSFIQIQLPEKTEEKSEAFKAGYKTISDLGKERIRRVVQKIKDENPGKSKEMDLGFKVFKLDSSNIKSWDGNPENLNESLFDAVGNIKTDRTEEDVLYEILLKYGLDLTLPIEEKTIEGLKVFNVGLGSLFICLADGITSKVAEGIGQWKEDCSPEICRVIFKDNGFTDVEKTNSVQTLKRYGINEIRSI
jgi:adenine-specific DNA-methyltransferase